MQSENVRSLYACTPRRLDRARRAFGRPLTLAEKILVAHSVDFDRQVWERGKVHPAERIEALHTMTREQIAWFRAGSALNAGLPIDLATGGTASLADATLAPGDTQAKPGKDKG